MSLTHRPKNLGGALVGGTALPPPALGQHTSGILALIPHTDFLSKCFAFAEIGLFRSAASGLQAGQLGGVHQSKILGDKGKIPSVTCGAH